MQLAYAQSDQGPSLSDNRIIGYYRMESICFAVQSNLDGSFTMATSYSFLSPYEILPTAQENKYLRKFSYFIVKLYVVRTH